MIKFGFHNIFNSCLSLTIGGMYLKYLYQPENKNCFESTKLKTWYQSSIGVTITMLVIILSFVGLIAYVNYIKTGNFISKRGAKVGYNLDIFVPFFSFIFMIFILSFRSQVTVIENSCVPTSTPFVRAIDALAIINLIYSFIRSYNIYRIHATYSINDLINKKLVN